MRESLEEMQEPQQEVGVFDTWKDIIVHGKKCFYSGRGVLLATAWTDKHCPGVLDRGFLTACHRDANVVVLT